MISGYMCRITALAWMWRIYLPTRSRHRHVKSVRSPCQCLHQPPLENTSTATALFISSPIDFLDYIFRFTQNKYMQRHTQKNKHQIGSKAASRENVPAM